MKLRLSQGVTYRSALEGTQGAGERDPKAAEPLRTALFSPEVGNTSCPSSGCSTVTQRKGEETWLAGEVAHPDLLYLPRCLRGCELPVLGPGIPSADVPGHQEHVHRELPPPAPQPPPLSIFPQAGECSLLGFTAGQRDEVSQTTLGCGLPPALTDLEDLQIVSRLLLP